MGRRSAVEISDSEDYSDCDHFYVSMYDDDDDDDDSVSEEQSDSGSDDDDDSEDESSTDSDDDDDDSDEDDELEYEYYYCGDDDEEEIEVFSYSEEEVEEKVTVLSRVKRTKKQIVRTSKSTKKSKTAASKPRRRSSASTKKDAVRKPLKKQIAKKKGKSSVTVKCSSSSCRKKPATTSARQGKEKAKPAKRVTGNTSSNKKKKHLVNRPMTFIVFDLETTGLHRTYHRIIEIALLDMDGVGRDTFHSLVDPGCPITNSHIHGITTKMVNRPDVPRMQGLIPNLLRFVKSRQKPRGYVVLVAHNARCFDVPFLANEFKRCSARIPSNWLFLDTLPLAREAMKSAGSQVTGRISLQALREHYGIPLFGSAHSAMSDVHSLSEVLQRIAFDLNLSTADLAQKTFTVKDLTVVKVKKKRG